jgi:hypothetical protein
MRKSTLATFGKSALVAASLIAPQVAISAEGQVSPATVLTVLIMADDTYGGCMVRLSLDPQSALPACGRSWVSLDCAGVGTDPVRAYRMLDLAQMAKATGKGVRVKFSDDLIQNGYCTATRIDVHS